MPRLLCRDLHRAWSGLSPEAQAWLWAKLRPGQRDCLRRVLTDPELGCKQLAEATGQPRGSVHRWLRLIRRGIGMAAERG